MTGGCAKYHDDLSAFVDETLPARRWDEIAYHLAGCKACRDDVVEIRDVRSTLATSLGPDVAAPSSLASRLEAIAGDAACQPLYIAASGPACALPSKRETRKRLAVRGSVAMLAVAMSVAVLAIILAPDPRLIQDPVGDAGEQFAMQTTALSVQEAVGAVLLAENRGARLGIGHVDPAPVPDGQALPISQAAADALVGRSARSDLSVEGVQQVWVTNQAGAWFTSRVQISRVAGEGTNLVVLDESGDRFLSSFLPELGAGAASVPDDWRFTTYPGLTVVADRDAVILEARSDERPIARWWLDVDTGLTLRSERYDTAGHPTIVVGFEEITVGEATLPDTRTQLISLSSASTSGTRGWCVGFEACPSVLAGLPLVAYSSSTVRGEEAMSLVYSNGIQTLTASWAQGRLSSDAATEASSAAGLPTVAAWQAGRGVVSVATNGSAELLSEAREALPAAAPFEDGAWGRFVGGMARLAGLG